MRRLERDLERERNEVVDPLFGDFTLPYALSVGIVRTGDWASSVPDRLSAEGRYGVRLDEDVDEARAALERTVAEAAAWTSSGGTVTSSRPSLPRMVASLPRLISARTASTLLPRRVAASPRDSLGGAWSSLGPRSSMSSLSPRRR